MKDVIIEKVVEVICGKGCQSVRADIVKLQHGQRLSETNGLNRVQRDQVLEELMTIMSVYGDTCRADGKLGSMISDDIKDRLEVTKR